MLRIIFLALSLLFALDAQAYVGPGSGIGLLGSLWAWVIGIFVVLMSLLIWPLRWMMRRMRKKAQARSADSSAGD
ncbi:hypothetical protein [Pseudomarimonas arenosa]|nr:hypothetical protein [Pseudomarimonas arenosa]